MKGRGQNRRKKNRRSSRVKHKKIESRTPSLQSPSSFRSPLVLEPQPKTLQEKHIPANKQQDGRENQHLRFVHCSKGSCAYFLEEGVFLIRVGSHLYVRISVQGPVRYQENNMSAILLPSSLLSSEVLKSELKITILKVQRLGRY